MTAYNVASRTSMVTGQPEDVSPILANFDLIAAVLNGNIDNANINAAAAIAASKLAGYPTDGAKALLGDGTWGPVSQVYVPVWTTTGVAPALGNGTLSGSYIRVGKIIMGRTLFLAGATTTFGTGMWSFSLPVTAANGQTGAVGQLDMADSSAGSGYHGVVYISGGGATKFDCYNFATPYANINSAVPFAWATTDYCNANYIYEAA